MLGNDHWARTESLTSLSSKDVFPNETTMLLLAHRYFPAIFQRFQIWYNEFLSI